MNNNQISFGYVYSENHIITIVELMKTKQNNQNKV